MRRGQISIEFLFLITIFMILLMYSINNTTFTSGPSVDLLATQINIEEKALANAISNTISQVYAQGPGAKATSYVTLAHINNENDIKKAFKLSDPLIIIFYSNGTYVAIVDSSNLTIRTYGASKNAFWSYSLYAKDLLTNYTVFGNRKTVNLDGNNIEIACLEIRPSDLPKEVKIVVEWNPDLKSSWSYSNGEIRVIIGD
ncbi:class III signal peptide-containing protein [Pyrococcus abyssi]|uniref:Class III signal peptide-containing protein n=1 Tax=Pyrococcus abyssi (strain GE5 / Orsay) TaxID=272844 RepID=Q9V0H7_PYRAB|nr:class III signal peptide-containing protein [Pyrococcus abyssi]CAB49726.1 Hypothetical protein PAB1822 [Pyrococcus abyssi GE5]CCE70213.1 TPA: hypothetical protein PAB1822 [Pyrococcus abyssi GE5]